MSDDRNPRRPFTKSVLFLMVLIAFSGVAIILMMNISHWNSIRKSRLFLAQHAAKQRQRLEGRVAVVKQKVVRDWLSKNLQHFRDLEVKYQQGASRPWESLPPDPPIPDLPTFQEFWESANAEPPEII